ncbi:VanZ family protein [Actinoplanes couchii]|uniref:VanZ-like domain-containing protein n=1 Tax=Actinoplanes couchii TaxID=403638 RepID=A0ABQ3XE42_9ACTN|nr:VanZ family protein [Actinoplanes couchii]MDR6317240.1 hypothetical protein [Actinoplanes couchii]GID56733.1 hypothetical protein Aco03nite_051370 [Actinoplanes couchii]
MTRRILLYAAALATVAVVLFVARRPLLMSAPACLSGDWPHCLGNENGIVLMTLLGMPVAFLVVAVLALLRKAFGSTAPWRNSLAEVGMVYGTAPMLWMTMSPGPGAGVVPGRVSLIPLVDLIGMGPLGIFVNLLILAALGFFAPIRFAALTTLPRVLALGAVCSALIETAQYTFQLDRVSSIDDVLLNATGAALAAALSHRWWRTTFPTAAPTGSPTISPAAAPTVSRAAASAASSAAAAADSLTASWDVSPAASSAASPAAVPADSPSASPATLPPASSSPGAELLDSAPGPVR